MRQATFGRDTCLLLQLLDLVYERARCQDYELTCLTSDCLAHGSCGVVTCSPAVVDRPEFASLLDDMARQRSPTPWAVDRIEVSSVSGRTGQPIVDLLVCLLLDPLGIGVRL